MDYLSIQVNKPCSISHILNFINVSQSRSYQPAHINPFTDSRGNLYHYSFTSIRELENVFVKHYAPNHKPDPKGEWSLKENISELHYRICSKVNQFIYTLVCNYMPNIRILEKAVFQTFSSQGCSSTKCLCPKKGSNSTENLRNKFKI